MRADGAWGGGGSKRRRGPHRTASERRALAEQVARYVRAAVRDGGGEPPSRAKIAADLALAPQDVRSALAWVEKGRRVCPCGREVRSLEPGRDRCTWCHRQSPEYLSDEQRRKRGPATVTRISRGSGFALSGRGRRWCAGGHVVDVRGFAPETLRAGTREVGGDLCVNCRAGEPVWSSALVWWDDTTVVVRRGPVNTSGPNRDLIQRQSGANRGV